MFELINNKRELNNIDSLLNDFLNPLCINKFHNSHTDLYCSDDDNTYSIELALPGLDKKDVSLNINDNCLYLNYKSTDDANGPYWKRSFSRRIKLPRNIQADSANAELKNGILSVTIKKDSTMGNHKIKIK